MHVAQQQAEEEEEVLQQLKLACVLPEDEQREAAGAHQLSGLLHAFVYALEENLVSSDCNLDIV